MSWWIWILIALLIYLLWVGFTVLLGLALIGVGRSIALMKDAGL